MLTPNSSDIVLCASQWHRDKVQLLDEDSECKKESNNCNCGVSKTLVEQLAAVQCYQSYSSRQVLATSSNQHKHQEQPVNSCGGLDRREIQSGTSYTFSWSFLSSNPKCSAHSESLRDCAYVETRQSSPFILLSTSSPGQVLRQTCELILSTAARVGEKLCSHDSTR